MMESPKKNTPNQKQQKKTRFTPEIFQQKASKKANEVIKLITNCLRTPRFAHRGSKKS